MITKSVLDLLWVGGTFKRVDFISSLRASGSKSYEELAGRDAIFSEFQNSRHKIEKFAFFAKTLHNKWITDAIWSDYADSLQLMKTCINSYFTSFAFAKQTAYRELFNRYIERLASKRDILADSSKTSNFCDRLSETGIVNQWFEDMAEGSGMRRVIVNQNLSESLERLALSLENVSGAFYLIGLGLLLSTIVFFLEVVTFKVKQRSKKQRRTHHAFSRS